MLIFERVSALARRHCGPIGEALVSLANDSAAYLLGAALLGLGNVVLIPLYTRTLAPSEFGIYALVDVTVLLLVAVTALRLDVSYLKWFADLGPACRGELLGTILLAGLASSFAGGLLFCLAVRSGLGELVLHAPVRSFAWLLLPIVVLETLQTLLLSDLRAQRRAVSYSVAPVIRLAVMIFFTYYLLGVRRAGLEGLFLGRLAGDAASVVYLTARTVRFGMLRCSLPLLRPMLSFGLPLIWSTFAVMLQDASGRYFLSRSGTLADVGLLSAAVKVGSIFQVLVAAPFGVAWGSLLFQIVKQPEARLVYTKILNYVCVFALGVALVLSLFASALIHLFTAPAYYSAIGILPFMLLVRAMNIIEQPASTGIYLSGKTGFFAGIYSIAFVLNLVLLRVLVPRFGVTGVAWAWLLSSASVPTLMLAIGQRFYRLGLSLKLILPPVVAWIVVTHWLPPASWSLSQPIWPTILVAVLVAAGFVCLLATDFQLLRRTWSTRGINE